MGRLLLILSFFLVFVYSFAKKELQNELINLTNLQEDEFMAIIFMKNGDCPKCYNIPMQILEKLELKKNHFKIVGAIKCFRKKELNIFKRDFEWKYFLYANNGTMRDNLHVNSTTVAIILDFKFNIIVKIDNKLFKKDFRTFLDFLSKLE